METEGIIVGSDKREEWLLPWWWEHYAQHISYPVCFMDFGMSDEMQQWCKARGQFHQITENTQALADATDPTSRELDKAIGSGFREKRSVWFKKPFACLAAPFKKNIWIDLDCLIMGSIAPIFHLLGSWGDFAIRREPPFMQQYAQKINVILEGEILYNTGVLAFLQGAPILQEWVNILKDTTHQFPGDQDALSRVIFLKKLSPIELSPYFNWPWNFPYSKFATIVHFCGPKGKEFLKAHINKAA